MITRRGFIGGASALALGAAIGIRAAKEIRYQASELSMRILGPEIFRMNAILAADEENDIFKIMIRGENDHVQATTRLQDVRKALLSNDNYWMPGKMVPASFKVQKSGCHLENREESYDARLVVNGPSFEIRVWCAGELAPVWLPLSHVAAVI